MRTVVGRSPVHPVLLVVGKTALAVSWSILALRLAGLDLLGVTVPSARWPALVVIIVCSLSVLVALKGLGSAARMGLPEEVEQTSLRTTGLYAVSRNPIYVAALAACAASCLYVPHWLNFAGTIVAALVHDRIIRSEERFLAERFGPQWEAYRARVRRYL
jgi:protein-S-isoprenylcysteine O-methyltransferase Ste14